MGKDVNTDNNMVETVNSRSPIQNFTGKTLENVYIIQ